MNSVVEIHDSTLASITHDGRDLVLCLAPAYVHRSAGRPGIDQGSGWLQDIDLIISDAVVESLPSELPVDLSDGALSTGEVQWDNCLPLPLAVRGTVSLTAVSCHGEILSVRGTGASAVTRGDARYVEEFSGQDDG